MREKNQMPKKSQTLLNRRKLSNGLSGRQLLPALLGEEVDGEADVVVVTGSQYTGVRATPRPPGPSTTTTTAAPTATTAPEAAASSSTTSTTVVGFVPEVPPGVDC